jgi:hypothetical protein
MTGYSDASAAANETTGELIGELSDFKKLIHSTAQDSRKFQIGLKFIL